MTVLLGGMFSCLFNAKWSTLNLLKGKESGLGLLVPSNVCYMTLFGEEKKNISAMAVEETAWNCCEGPSLFYLYWMQNFLCPLTVSSQEYQQKVAFSLHNVSSVEWEGS